MSSSAPGTPAGASAGAKALAEAIVAHGAWRLADAARGYRTALAVTPADPVALGNLGSLLRGAGHPMQAERILRRALVAEPRHAVAYGNLGNLLKQQGRLDDALDAHRRGMLLDPFDAIGHANWANTCHVLLRHAEAERAARRGCLFDPLLTEAQIALGMTLEITGRSAEAACRYRAALCIEPSSLRALTNLAGRLATRGDAERAVQLYRRGCCVQPGNADTLTNLGGALRDQGRLAEAAAALARAIALAPASATAHYNLGIVLLTRGQLAAGFAEHAWRWQLWRKRSFRQPRWPGGALAGQSLYVWGEQGLGEEVLHAGVIPDAIRAGVQVTIECNSRLVRLLARSFPRARVLARPDPLPAELDVAPCAWHLPSGDLVAQFRRRMRDFPRRRRYLTVDPATRQRLRARYRAMAEGLIVGISWRSHNAQLSATKSTDLLDWAPILRIPGVLFVSLQYGDSGVELAAVQDRFGVTVHRERTVDPSGDLDPFAAQVAAMDLVISTSSTTAHLAGATGTPVWTLLPQAHGLLWHWFAERADSPWYPSMRLYRQAPGAGWAAPTAALAADLEAQVHGRL